MAIDVNELLDFFYNQLVHEDHKYVIERKHNGFKWFFSPDLIHEFSYKGYLSGPGGDDDKAHIFESVVPILGKFNNSYHNYTILMNAISNCVTCAVPVVDGSNVSLVLRLNINDSVSSWMKEFILLQILLQLFEAESLANVLAKLTGSSVYKKLFSKSKRKDVDPLLVTIDKEFIPEGKNKSYCDSSELKKAYDFLCRSFNPEFKENELVVQLPYKLFPTIFRMKNDLAHPVYGNGLLISQLFYDTDLFGNKGIQPGLCNHLNKTVLQKPSACYGMGTFSPADNDIIAYNLFIPNKLYKKNMSINFALSSLIINNLVSEQISTYMRSGGL